MNTLIQNLRESTQLLVFFVSIAAGIVYLFASWVLGHFGGGDHGGEGHDHEHADSGHSTVSIFSPKIIALFMIGLGAGGCLSTIYGGGPTTASLIGLASGMSLGGLMLIGLRMLYSQQASSNLDVGSAVGRMGTVTVDIPPMGTGEVGLYVGGQYATFFARAKDGTQIARGRQIKVASVTGSTLVVQDSV
jgi:membrane protein implicated in regulation of membrane protease activity